MTLCRIIFATLLTVLFELHASAQCSAPPAGGCPLFAVGTVTFSGTNTLKSAQPMSQNADPIIVMVWGQMGLNTDTVGAVNDAVQGWTALPGSNQDANYPIIVQAELPQNVIDDPSLLNGTESSPVYAIGLGAFPQSCPTTVMDSSGNTEPAAACTIISTDGNGVITNSVTVMNPTLLVPGGTVPFWQDYTTLELLDTHEAGIALFDFQDCTGTSCANSVTNPVNSFSVPTICDQFGVYMATGGTWGLPLNCVPLNSFTSPDSGSGSAPTSDSGSGTGGDGGTATESATIFAGQDNSTGDITVTEQTTTILFNMDGTINSVTVSTTATDFTTATTTQSDVSTNYNSDGTTTVTNSFTDASGSTTVVSSVTYDASGNVISSDGGGGGSSSSGSSGTTSSGTTSNDTTSSDNTGTGSGADSYDIEFCALYDNPCWCSYYSPI